MCCLLTRYFVYSRDISSTHELPCLLTRCPVYSQDTVSIREMPCLLTSCPKIRVHISAPVSSASAMTATPSVATACTDDSSLLASFSLSFSLPFASLLDLPGVGCCYILVNVLDVTQLIYIDNRHINRTTFMTMK